MEAFHCHLLQNVLSGAGIAIVTAASVPNGSLLEVQDDRALRFLPIRDSEAYQSIVLRWNDRHPLSPASEMFLKYVEDAFSERQKCVTCPGPADPDRRCRTTGECAACTVAFPR